MTSAPTIILLPGLHGSTRLFAPFVQHLRRELPKSNILPLPLPERGPQDYATLAGPFIDRLAPLGPICLLAESFSGPLALRLAASPRLRVSRLILAASFCGAPHSLAFSLVPLRPLFSFRVPKKVIRHFLTGQSATEALVDSVRTEIQAARGKTLADRVRAALELRADSCPLPTATDILLLQAQNDALLPWETQAELERQLPEATVEWIEAPHLLLQTRPADCAKRAAAFLLR